MKTYHYFLTLMWLFFFILPLNVLAENKEMPITTSSKEALNLFIAGRAKFEDFEFINATPLFDKAIQKDPDFAMAYLYRSFSSGGYNVLRQNLEQAVKLVNKVSEGERYEILYYQARTTGDYQKEKEYFNLLLKLFYTDKRVQLLAGNYYYYQNDYTNALQHYRKCSELDKNYELAYNMIGYCQSGLGNYQAAEKAFQTYIKLSPNNPNPYDSYAELLLKMGKYDLSIAQYKKALEKDPNYLSSMAGIGNNYIFKGNFETARKCYQEYFDKSPSIDSKLSALYWKAVSYVHEGNTEKAVNVFDEYRALAEQENLINEEFAAYKNQGYILSESGNPAEGIKYFEKANALIAKSKLSDFEKENLNTCSMLCRFYYLTIQEKLLKAKLESDNCKQKVELRKNPSEKKQLHSIFIIYQIKKGDYNKAIECSKLASGNPVDWYYTAIAYKKMGDKNNSQKLFDQIKKCNVNSLDLALIRKNALEE